MIVADTSALAAIVLGEHEGKACLDVLVSEADVLLSAGTMAEALIVAGRHNQADEMRMLLERFSFDVVPVTRVFAAKVAAAYTQWGKGVHAARLNFGDCFAYALAAEKGCPLLYIGNDFARTDAKSAL